MDFSPSCQAYKIPISWHKTSKTQHFMNYWCFWSWKPVFLHFIKQNYSKRSRKTQGASWETYYLWKSENWNFRKFPNSGNLKCSLFGFLKFRIPEFLIIRNDEFLKIMKSRRRGISWHSFCRWNFLKSLDMNLVSIKNMKRKFPNFPIPGCALGYFQSSAKRRVPITILAPNQACLGS